MARRRRGRGEGGVELLKSGKYKAVVCRTVNGARVRSSKVFDAKADALAYLRQGAETGPTAPLTLAAWVALWLPLHKGRVGAKTYKGDKWAVDTYLLAHHDFAKTKLRDLDSVAVETHLTGLDVSVSERHKAAKLLRNVLNAAVRAKKLPASPMGGAGGARMPKKPKSEAKSLTPDELKALLDAADAGGHGPIIRLWVDSGMRPGEVLGLKWKDFDPAAGTVRVERALDRATNELKGTKTEETRTVVLSPSTAASLAALRRGRPDGPVFHPPGGGALHWWPDNFSTWVFRPLVAAAGLPHCTPYMLRHTCATLLIRAGVSLRIVSERLGHKDVATTLKHYAHCLPDDQHRAAAAWQGVLDGLAPPPHGIPTAGADGAGERGRKR